ncbi:gp53-like domain-containing protein [Burkholderia sp. BDU5]|uniref:gp53-like domain-containing protein n=1 Tax=Burkholderia sp. BDU5 TaxID=1385590 RepID=UPI000B0065E4|nr:hypothetical protein [Burkholderia sp. BDU5]
MGTSDFKAFAAGPNANVMAQADYIALAALLTGFQSGTAQSVQVNKVLRQSSIMSAVLAQFTANFSGQNSVDDGTTATLLANLQAAINAAGITAPQFDNSTKLATTAFAQRALGNRQAISSTNTNQTLTLAQCGQTLQYYSVSGGVWTLPAAATIPNGAEYEILNGGSGTLLIQVAGGSDKIISSSGVAITSITLQSGDSIRIVGSAGSYVYATGGTGTIQWSASFGSSIALNGYQKLPSGWIIQWGAFTSSASGDTSVAWPIAFPNTCLSVLSTPNNNGYSMVTQYNSSRTGALFNNWQMSGGSAVRMAGAVQYVAIGN